MDVKPEDLIWTAKNIVDFAGVVAWPISSILLAIILRSKVTGFLDGFLRRNKVTELSAGGFTAKFTQSNQAMSFQGQEDKHDIIISEKSSGDGASDYFNRLSQDETKTSNHILKNIRQSIESIKMTESQAVEALTKELSLVYSKLYFVDLNRVLYRSQYELFKLLRDSSGSLSEAQVSAYFDNVKLRFSSVYGYSDLISYLAYPMNVGLIEKRDGCYCLTDYGDSYVAFMDRNSNLIMGLMQS